MFNDQLCHFCVGVHPPIIPIRSAQQYTIIAVCNCVLGHI